MTDRLHLDFETASDLDLRKVGAYRYASHESTRVLMLGWAVNDELEELWQPHINPEPPTRLVHHLRNSNTNKHAFNAQFERLITKHCMGIEVPYREWRCTMVEAFYLGFAGRLDMILQAIGLAEKDKRGGQLINLFCTPAPSNHHATWYDWSNRPADWDDFCQYCRQDVRVERELYHWLHQFPSMSQWDWNQWFLDQRINDRGVHMDLDMAYAAIEVWDLEKESLKDQLSLLTGMQKVTRTPFLEHINTTFGVDLEGTRKDYLASKIQKGELPEPAKILVDLWAQKEAKATSKFTAILNATGENQRARGMFQYKGASRTDRAGGRIIQLQNLKRPFVAPDQIQTLVNDIKHGNPDLLKFTYKKSVSEVLGGSIRHAIQAPYGRSLAVSDLSSIESVVLGWVCYCTTIDHTFRSGKDSYKVFAEQFFGVPYDQVTKDQRGFSKPPVLGCGYMLGWRGLVAYAEGYGVEMDELTARRAVDTFRNMYPEIVAFWKWIYDAVKYTTTTHQACEGYRLRIERDPEFLRIVLPSGRALSYYQPDIRKMPAPWDPNKSVMNFTYMGMNDKNQWVRISAHAGGVTENIVQSIAGDILWNGLTLADQKELEIVLHVHDEIAAETDDWCAEHTLQTLNTCMTTKCWWNQDMWLGSDGFLTKRYTKD